MSAGEKKLNTLFSVWGAAVAGTNYPKPPPYDGPDITITNLTENTANVEQSSCFVARVRPTSDGHPYIEKAISKGASLIIAQKPADDLNVSLPEEVVYLQVPDTAQTMAWLAAAWEGFPSKDLVMIGITGTDGKTSTANILYSILKAAGLKVGLLSTIKAVIGQVEEPLALHVTTPEAPVVQNYLRRMANSGLTHCIVESTSHGLAQHRVGAIDFDLAVVTNITHEHLDYHGTYERYFAAKARLVEWLAHKPFNLSTQNFFKKLILKKAVLNLDDSSFSNLMKIEGSKKISYGLSAGADVSAEDISFSARGTDFIVITSDSSSGSQGLQMPVSSHLAGKFNVYNMLAGAAAALALGVNLNEIRMGLQSVSSISGRMEPIDLGQPFIVIVDFAHTPNALEKVIDAARDMEPARIITVFGSAGKRDIEKRRLMAEISAQRADLTILTAEDPRTESLEEILQLMASGCIRHGGEEGKTFWRIPDRGQAIFDALMMARQDDIVLICGKGHEQSMCFGTTEYPWDDRQATRTALKAVLNNQPMVDLGLPTFSKST